MTTAEKEDLPWKQEDRVPTAKKDQERGDTSLPKLLPELDMSKLVVGRLFEANLLELCHGRQSLPRTLQAPLGSPTPPLPQLHLLENIISAPFPPTGIVERALQDIQC